MKTYIERVELAEKLLRGDKPCRYIASKTKFTPNKISEIKKKLLGIDADPKHTQAYRLFHFDGKGVLEAALELGLTQEQSEKYYLEYFKMRKKDRLVSLFKDEDKLESLLMLLQTLTDKNIPEDEYQFLISRIRYNDPPEWQKRAFETDVSMLKCEISKLKSDTAKAQIDLATISREYTEKIQTIPKLKEEYEALENKNKKFRSSIELLIKGNAGLLIEAILDVRFEFNKWSLSAFLNDFSQIVLDTLQFDPDMTCRLSGINYHFDNPHWFCERLKQQGEFYIDEWLQDPTKWLPIDEGIMPLRV